MKNLVSSAKPAILASSLGVVLISSQSQGALVVWDGTDGEYTDAAKWGGTLPDTEHGDTARITAGNVNYTAGPDLLIRNSGVLDIQGGSFTQTGGGAWIQLDGGTLNVAGGTFNQGTAGLINKNASSVISVTGGVGNFNGDFNYTSASPGTFNVSGGIANIGGNFLYNGATGGLASFSGGTINITGNFIYQGAGGGPALMSGGTANVTNEFKPLETFNMTTGSLKANLISFADGPGSINFSGGTIELNGAGTYSGFYGGGSKSLNFTSGSAGSLFFSGYTLADLTADGFLTNGTLRYDGAISAGSFSTIESGGGVFVTVVPEPASTIFFLAGAGVVMFSRRRNQR